MTRKERLKRRDRNVRSLFTKLSKKHPQWRVDAVIKEVSERVFLSPRTVEGILRCEGIYADC